MSFPEPPYAVLGLGHVGGSLARALSRFLPEAKVIGVDPKPKARALALRDGTVVEALEAPGPALSRCGLVFVCVPFSALEPLLASLKDHLHPDAILTDVLGSKRAVDELVLRVLPGVKFVGGHPLIPGELREPAGWRPDAFAGKPVAICPRDGEEALAARVAAVWSTLGARPVVISSADHDRVVAATVQLPYLAALALARVAGAVEGAPRLPSKVLLDALRPVAGAADAIVPALHHNAFAPAVARVLADELRRLADLAENEPAALEAAAAEARDLKSRLG